MARTATNAAGISAAGMTRKTFLKGSAVMIGASAFGFPALGRAAKRPNILFVCTDQEQSWMELPDILPLPHHEWLRTNGAAFDNYHVQTTPCGPSRSNIYTGQHTQRTGVFMNPNTPPQPELAVDFPTIGDMMRSLGYHTAYKGKWHLSNVNRGRKFGGVAGGIYPNAQNALEPYGFSEFNFYGEAVGLSWDGFKLDGTIAGDAARAMRNYAAGAIDDKPWFLAVNLINPHDIMFFDATGEQNKTRILQDAISPIIGAPGTQSYERKWDVPLPRSFYEDDLSTKPEMHRALRDGSRGFYGAMPKEDEASWRRFRDYYFNCVVDVDRHIGVLLDTLRDTDQLDNTIIVYTSDHGERNGAHGLRQKAGTIYKEEVRVPLIIRRPGGPHFSTSALAGAIDLVPTLISLATEGKPSELPGSVSLPGIDLSPALESANHRTERDKRGILFNYVSKYYWGAVPGATIIDAVLALSRDPEAPLIAPADYDLTKRRLHRGVHDGRYKFARYFAPNDHHQPRDWDELLARNDLELYDTKNDPDEIINLAFAPGGSQLPIELKARLEVLNKMTNNLVQREIGEDKGAVYRDGLEKYNLREYQ